MFRASRSVVGRVGLGSLVALGACSGTTDGGRSEFSPSGGALGAGSGTGSGNGPGSSGGSNVGGANSSFAGGVANSGGAGPIGGGGASGVSGATAVGGWPSGGATGASCVGLTPWTAGTTATDVSHNGKHYTCKVEGWCSSTAAAGAYEPGVGFAWMDAWTDDGACGNGGNGGASSGGATGRAGSTGNAGSGAAGAPSTGCVLDSLLGETNFDSWFPTRNSFYTYANLCKAMAKYPAFATTGDDTAKKREVAGFFANVARETGMLVYIDQISKDPSTGNYWGRGPLQITWDYNYKACGTAIGADLFDTPTLVSTDGAITWETGLWFWMTNDGGTGTTPHQAIVAGNFGGTIRAINGGIECNGPNEGANERIQHYQAFCQSLGVDPGSMLTCW
jgi:predicted chitinase